MNAIYLHLPDGTPTKWSMCAECHTVAAPGNFDLSEKCCSCYDCGLPLPKDERVKYASGSGYSLYHRECEAKRRAEREQERLDKAELVPDYDGPVFMDGYGHGSYGDGYFSDVYELAEILDSRLMDSDEWPAFAFCCESSPVAGLDLSNILASHCEEAFEDAEDHLSGIEELQKAVDAFNELNKDVLSWNPDYKRKVAIPPRAEVA